MTDRWFNGWLRVYIIGILALAGFGPLLILNRWFPVTTNRVMAFYDNAAGWRCRVGWSMWVAAIVLAMPVLTLVTWLLALLCQWLGRHILIAWAA